MESILLNNRYRLLELIGSGGMAVVYRGLDTLLQRQVAIKILRQEFASDPAFLTRFQREARAAANLEHPHIVTVHDVGQDEERHYIVMEYIDGQDLKTLIRQQGRLTVNQALDIAIQISAGVGHAHKAGIIHCDIKPQNVLVTSDGRAKVTDFGIARALSSSGITESETVWGSPLYFSPEQAAGDPPSPASDVYSIGVVIYEMLASIPPFQAEKPAALALMHIREEPSPLAVHCPHVPAQLEWIVRKTLAKEPSARYRTATQLAHVLEEYRKQSEQLTGWQPAVPHPFPSAVTPSPTPEPEPPPPSSLDLARLTWILGGVALVLVVGLIPLWVWVYRAYSASPTLAPPTATTQPLVTLTPETPLVSVPNLIGHPVEEAQTDVERVGLRLVLQEEREDPTAERDTVLEQSPAPGERVPPDTAISVIVNRPARELTMPRIEGYPVDMVRKGLESDGLQVTIHEVWSTEEAGKVLAQAPEPGTLVYAGDAVTLTVSGGVDIPIPLQVNLANLIVLKDAELRQNSFRPGGVTAVTLHWHAARSINTHYVVFLHLIDANGNLVAQQDVEPITPTTDWIPGVEITDPHQITIPADQPTGWYQLRVGMYPQGQPEYRLPIVDVGATTQDSGSILITEIEVTR
ncbi:MAG TPA: Stk1 family PASTA domain-containing Ser/Thr kinase [Chloroflexi bacterium]|nr:Stk1 family PASTA domain-containing Ser/Thr kinase [Chloroflexota bacterium]